MGQGGKMVVIILGILLLLSLAGAAIGFYSYRQEKRTVVALGKELEDVKAKRIEAERKLTDSQSRISELNTQLAATQKQINELNSELDKAKQDNKQLKSQTENLQAKLVKQKALKEEWEARQVQTQNEIDKLQALLKSLQVSKEELETQLTKLEARKEVALGKIVVGEEKPVKEAPAVRVATRAPATLKGKVLVVNRDYDFAVINLGSKNGLGAGEVLSVYRDDNYIGEIQVERVQETMSACGFISADIENKFKEGDDIALGRIAAAEEKPAKEAPAVKVVAAPTPAPKPAAAPTPAVAPVAAPPLKGKVLVVNRDYDFAVINLGSKNGLGAGEVFLVYRNGDYIGDIQVDKVQSNMGSCVFLSESVKNKIKEGDKVIRK